MLRTAAIFAILGAFAVLPGRSQDGTTLDAGPAGAAAEVRRPQPRLFRPRRAPPLQTVCRETAIPDPAPSCGP